MKIKFSPQVSDNKIDYTFYKDKIEVLMFYSKESFEEVLNFEGLPNGELALVDKNGKDIIETDLPVNVLLGAKKIDGELSVELLLWVGINENREHILFPKEIDSRNYLDWINGADE